MEPRFVDRIEELEFLEELSTKGFYPVLYISVSYTHLTLPTTERV